MISYQKLTSSELVGIHNGQQLEKSSEKSNCKLYKLLKNTKIFKYIDNVLYLKL